MMEISLKKNYHHHLNDPMILFRNYNDDVWMDG